MPAAKKHRTYNVWQKHAILKLPGATTTVTIDFGSLTPRMRTNIRKHFDAIVRAGTTEHKRPGYYSKSSQLLDLLLNYYDIPKARIESDYISIDCVTSDLWDKAYALAQADVAEYLLTDDGSPRWKDHIRSTLMQASEEYGLTKTKFSWWSRSKGFNEELLDELKKDYSKYAMEVYASRIVNVEEVVKNGGVIQVELI